MSHATRFLGVVVAGWVGLRVVGSGLAGTDTLAAPAAGASDMAAAITPAADPAPAPATFGTRFSAPPAAPQLLPAGAILTPYGYLLPFEGAAPLPDVAQAPPVQHVHHYERVPIPLPYAAPAPSPAWSLPPAFPFPAQPALDPALSAFSLGDGSALYSQAIGAAAVPPPIQHTPAAAGTAPADAPFDRWQLSGWSFTREAYAEDAASAPGLAPGSMLGGAQAGARLVYNHDERFGLGLRFSSATGSIRGDEVALGIRYTPFRGLPLALTAERREAIGDGAAARSAFALFAEGGVWQRPLGLGFALDGYAQAGLVGLEERDWFIDGALTASRPVFKNIRIGAGLWGAAQPGLERLDAGPRLTLPVYRGVRLHADYRAQLLGNAAPGSGPALTLAADL
ncbi:hypothetical protein [Sphingomicrobium aestuariivivum]|uniref:hypothetical protein n=1 Tax=Sphingomicrobium aestuariivivum TaxID=1582356 RepID=UPI001FD6CEEE|nr:hypothetical protein [Sphingomicrobium aestuariivivum]MCJ8191051.1 hypothetical protein [Sphingomicrobium aestuariivivum]